ncbi:MAG: GMP synthase [Anaerolineaceae bacterium]|nr:MAG: GMP synthase [Anaerolineaceae bacterium]
MNIGLLQCDHVDAGFQHLLHDYDVAFRDLFKHHAPQINLTVYDACHGQLPDAVSACDGYIISGSRHSAYDQLDWITQLADFVRRVHQQQHKMVGICFGHQVIAHALGGKVAKSANGWGVGVKPVDMQNTRAWMHPETPSYHLLLSHQDQVLTLPDGAEVLGGNAHCPVSMFAIADHLLGLQAHPEFTPQYAEALLSARLDRIGHEVAEAARHTLQTPTDEAIITQWIAAFFAA